MNNRTFIFAEGNYAGQCGGGTGGAYLLIEADRKYGLLKEPYFVFGDMVIAPSDSIPEKSNIKKSKNMPSSRLKLKLKKALPALFFSMRRGYLWRKNIRTLKRYYASINNMYRFTSDDAFIFQSYVCAYAFGKIFSYNYAVIYHGQGGPYYEWKLFTGNDEDKRERKRRNGALCDVMRKAQYCGFPSWGTVEALTETTPETCKIIDFNKVRILYSGLNCLPVGITWQVALEIKDFSGLKFISIAMLNYAKGVERIPQYLGAIAKAGYDFRWVVIGNGVMADEFESTVAQYGITDKLIWIKDYISHDKIQQILSVTDFYILFHRYSIFDLSTLEAMGYGNIPILTPVGGNKEMIIRENGIFVSDFGDISGFQELVSGDIAKLKESNIALQREQFSSRPFLQRYADLCSEMLKG